MLQLHAGDSYGYRFAADGKDRRLLDRLRAQARRPRGDRGVRRLLPRRRPGDLRRDVLARRRDLGQGGLGPLEQHRRRRAVPDGRRAAPLPLPSRARVRRRGDRARAGGNAALRGAHARRPRRFASRPPTTAWRSRCERCGRGAAGRARTPRITAIGVALLAGARPRWSARAHRWNAGCSAAWFDACQRRAARVGVDARHRGRDRRAEPRAPRPVAVAAHAPRRADRRHRCATSPAAIGVDILMPEPDRLSPERLLRARARRIPCSRERPRALPSNDEVLARALAAAPRARARRDARADRATPRGATRPVVDRAARGASGRTPRATLPRFAGVPDIDALDAPPRATARLGRPPRDASCAASARRARRRTLVPALAIEMLRVALGAPASPVRRRRRRASRRRRRLRRADRGATARLRIHFSPRDARRFVSAVDVLDGEVEPERLARQAGPGGRDRPRARRLPHHAARRAHARQRDPRAAAREPRRRNAGSTRPRWAPWARARAVRAARARC